VIQVEIVASIKNFIVVLVVSLLISVGVGVIQVEQSQVFDESIPDSDGLPLIPLDPEPTPSPEPDPEPIPPPEPEPEPSSIIEIDVSATCIKITDGDTFELSNGDIIRLADVDTPERGQPGYQEATDYLRSLIYDKTVYLEVDAEKDIYGRYVCVVYRKNGLNVNWMLLSEGYAVFDDYQNDFEPATWSRDNEFDTSEATIIRPPRTPEPEPVDPWLLEGPFVGSTKSNKYHKASCYWAKQILPANLRTFSTRKKAINAEYVACKVCKP
jgi:micrococcal nuclease